MFWCSCATFEGCVLCFCLVLVDVVSGWFGYCVFWVSGGCLLFGLWVLRYRLAVGFGFGVGGLF